MLNSQESVDNSMDEKIIIEWATSERGIRKVSRDDALKKMQAEAERALNIAMGNIRSMARRMAQTMGQLEDKTRPDEAEIEFGLNLDADVGAFLARASGGAQINVKLKWNIEQPQRPKVFVSE
jgi:hypothetical protein